MDEDFKRLIEQEHLDKKAREGMHGSGVIVAGFLRGLLDSNVEKDVAYMLTCQFVSELVKQIHEQAMKERDGLRKQQQES